MALKATIYKAQLQIADIDRHYYHEHQLTLARHPSENSERMMLRLLAFMLNAHDELHFNKGLCVDGEAELWQKELSGEITLWVEFGQPDEKWLRKACNQSKQVQLFCYGDRSVPIWWQQHQQALARYNNLKIWNIADASLQALGAMAKRNMALQCNINEGQLWISDNDTSIVIEPKILKELTN